MTEINRSTETAFVKTNMVHKLHKMNKCGLMPLLEFKELLKPKDYTACERCPKPYAWYNFTSEVFIKFLNWAEVEAIAEDGGRVYKEKTPVSLQTSNGVVEAMNMAMQASIKSFRSEFKKLSSVANPKNTPPFLEEVNNH